MNRGGLPSNIQYKDPEYWDQRFAEEDSYEWLASYSDISGLFKDALNRIGPNAKILQLGCGNSKLALDLYEDGFEDITNIDISEVVIEKMQVKFPYMKFVKMDMTKLDFGSKQFDLVIEKATLDALLVDSKSPWDLTSNGSKQVLEALHSVKSVLQPGGVFMSITFSQPHFRVPLLAQPGLDWAIQVDKFTTTGGVLDYYTFKCSDGSPANAVAEWCVSNGPNIEMNDTWTSSDEEDYLTKIGTSSLGSSSEEDINNSVG